MNRCFQGPLVESVAGGKRGDGAQLTELGHQVVALYGALLAETERAIAAHKAQREALLADPLPADD